MALARAVHPLPLLEADDRLGDEAARTTPPPGRPTRRDARYVCRELRVPVQAAGLRDREVDLGRGRPLVAEQLLDVADGAGDRRHHRVAVLRVVDRVLRDLGERQRAVVAQHRHPAAERAGDDGRERAGAGNERRGRARRGSARSSRPAAPAPARRARRGSPRAAGKRIAGRSPPGPFRCGSTTCSVSPAATAASKALPPCSSTAIPAADASQCVEATIPNVPRSSGRVVKLIGSPRGRRRRPRRRAEARACPARRDGRRRGAPGRTRAAAAPRRSTPAPTAARAGSASGSGIRTAASSGLGTSPSSRTRCRERCTTGSGTSAAERSACV